jgi:hypothetical protein
MRIYALEAPVLITEIDRVAEQSGQLKKKTTDSVSGDDQNIFWSFPTRPRGVTQIKFAQVEEPTDYLASNSWKVDCCVIYSLAKTAWHIKSAEEETRVSVRQG